MNTRKKPSDIHNNSDLLKSAANEANRKRKQRRSDKARQERIRKERQKDMILRTINKGDKINFFQLLNLGAKPSSSKLGKKIKVMCDGIGYDNLNSALRGSEPKLWAEENDYRRSCWTKINRNLKKHGVFEIKGHTFILI